MFLEPPNISEIVVLMQAVDVNKAVGHDSIPAFFIKVSKFVIAPYLNMLIDFAFFNGTFPDSCKTAKVILLLKSGNVNYPNNYCPISILTCFSKIFEKLLHKHLSEFLNKNNVIIMNKLKSFLPWNVLLQLYYALVHPHLLYGLSVWGSKHYSCCMGRRL